MDSQLSALKRFRNF